MCKLTNGVTDNLLNKYKDLVSKYRYRVYVVDFSNITEEEYLLHERKQWYMTAEEMKTFGVVDKIIGVDCDDY